MKTKATSSIGYCQEKEKENGREEKKREIEKKFFPLFVCVWMWMWMPLLLHESKDKEKRKKKNLEFGSCELLQETQVPTGVEALAAPRQRGCGPHQVEIDIIASPTVTPCQGNLTFAKFPLL